MKDLETKIWSIRGVPKDLIDEVKAVARRDGMNIGKLVENSLRAYFADQAKDTPNNTFVDERAVAEAERRLLIAIEDKFSKLKQ